MTIVRGITLVTCSKAGQINNIDVWKEICHSSLKKNIEGLRNRLRVFYKYLPVVFVVFQMAVGPPVFHVCLKTEEDLRYKPLRFPVLSIFGAFNRCSHFQTNHAAQSCRLVTHRRRIVPRLVLEKIESLVAVPAYCVSRASQSIRQMLLKCCRNGQQSNSSKTVWMLGLVSKLVIFHVFWVGLGLHEASKLLCNCHDTVSRCFVWFQTKQFWKFS